MLLALDFERNPNGATMNLEQARTFVSHVRNATGRWPGLYGGALIKELLGTNTDGVLANCWLWLSQYGTNAVVPPNWSRWTLWQFTDGKKGPEPHEVDGIGPCDRDTFDGTLVELRSLFGA
jgi:lysozyme